MVARCLAVAIGLLLATETAVGQAAVPPGGTVRGEAATRLDQHLSRAERFGFSGVVVVGRDGVVLLSKAYGLADRAAGRRVTPETVFDIGSITKPFTASAVLKLVDEGKLRVTDSIAHFFDSVPADKKAITIHHLLTHTSGLQGGFGGDYDLITRDSLVRLALTSELQSAPGAKCDYSNAGYSLLGAIVEKVSGLPYERYLKDSVLAPVGVSSTGYRLVEWAGKPVAVGYRGSGRLGTPLEQRWANDGPSWHLRANGGLLSTAGDLYRWLAAFHDHRIVSRASYEKATTVPAGSEYGYGWEIGQLGNGKRFITHNGSNGYFYSRALYLPDEKTTIVFMTNDMANRSMESDILDSMLERPIKEIPSVAASSLPLTPYAGRYRTSSGTEFIIRSTSEGLEITGAPAEVVASLVLPSPGPRAGAVVDSALTNAVSAMAVGNHAPYRERFWPFRDYRIDGEVQFWTEVFNDWRSDYGEYIGPRVLGTVESGSGEGSQLTSYVALKYAKGERVLRIIQPQPATGKFFAATVSTAQWPTRYVIAPRSRTDFITYNLELRKAAEMTFAFGDGGSVKAIVLPGGLRAERIGAATD